LTSRIIAIAGAKGSPGCSFLALALARCLAAASVPTLLLDADAEGGGLAAMLDLVPATQAGALEGNALDAPVAQIDKRLWFAEVGQAGTEASNGLELARAARSNHHAVVVDFGHSAGPLQRQMSAASDWLLWVVAPDRSGIDRADRVLTSRALDAASSGLVFNRIKRGCLDHADDVLSSRHGIRVMARINEDRRVADSVSQGRTVHRQWGLKRTLNELARSVHPAVAQRVPAWF
jgi:MinD-like ATPase involved in chromosome partitioning or flagellar assembly